MRPLFLLLGLWLPIGTGIARAQVGEAPTEAPTEAPNEAPNEASHGTPTEPSDGAVRLDDRLSVGPRPNLEFSVTIQPRTIRVGEEFVMSIAAEVPRGVRLLVPDTLPSGPLLESSRRVRILETPTKDGTVLWAAEYTMVAWRPGLIPLPEFRLSLVREDAGEYGGNLGLRQVLPGSVSVASVLPPDGGSVAPRGPTGPVGEGRSLWLVIPGLVMVGGGLSGLLGRRVLRFRERIMRPVGGPPPHIVRARLDGIQAVEKILNGPLPPAVPAVQVVEELTTILRRFLLDVNPELPRGSTTPEIVEGLKEILPRDLLTTLHHILNASDRVRFGKGSWEQGDARWLGRGVHHWIRESSSFFLEKADDD